MTQTHDDERLRRWRLILGADAAEGTGISLAGQDAAIDGVLQALYGRQGGLGSGGLDSPESKKDRSGSLGSSAPTVARWLGDIRTYFPTSVVRVMQKDAMTRLGLNQLLLEPEMLEAV